jgi:lipopolysaccharide transport system permease protein
MSTVLLPAAPAEGQRAGYRIEARRGRFTFGMRELWEYRELLYFLVWRDLKIRYQRRSPGSSWALLQPFVTMIVFTLVFNRLGGSAQYHVPYRCS